MTDNDLRLIVLTHVALAHAEADQPMPNYVFISSFLRTANAACEELKNRQLGQKPPPQAVDTYTIKDIL